MDKESSRGRPSIWSKELGHGVNKKPRYPIPVWDVLSQESTKHLLDGMAMDPEIKRKAHELGEEWKNKKGHP
jgi:hypothetical protein